MMPSGYGLVMVAVTLAAAPLSWQLSRRGRRAALCLALAGLGLVGLGFLPRVVPELLIRAGESQVLLWTHGSVLAWGALILLGACVSLLKRRPVAGLVGGFCVVAAGVLSSYPFRLIALAPDDLRGTPSLRKEVCSQSATWSCGPAAAAMMLARIGVPADEAVMARRCGTIPGRGTTEYGLWHGLRTSLDPDRYDVRIVRSAEMPIDQLPIPSLLSVRSWLGSGHAVVLIRLGKRMAVIADPAKPNVSYLPREDFRRFWQGCALVVEPTG